MGWLDDHLVEFVVPKLKADEVMKEYPEDKILRDIKSVGPLGYFKSEEMTVIKNAWRATKKAAGDKPILLAGRDVFIFEILARRENYPTRFIPECSRMTASHLAKTIPDVKDYFLFDTGFVGSIPRALGIDNFSLLSWSRPLNIWDDSFNAIESKQIFPRMTMSRSLALKIEVTPKYWESGRIGTNIALIQADPDAQIPLRDKIIQPFSSPVEFVNAARLTIEIYKDSSPKFVKKHRPISPERRW